MNPVAYPSTQRTPNWGDRAARALLHTRLSQTKGGKLTLRDSEERAEFGEEGFLHAEVEILDPRVYRMLLRQGAIGAAEAYRRGWWRSPDLVALFRILVRQIGTESRLERLVASVGSLQAILGHNVRRNSRLDSPEHIRAHYDLGNEFFGLFLDPTLTYSAAIFACEESTLEDASRTKLRRICQKLALEPGLHVLEIGSGWGSLALTAAAEFGCRVTTVTLSSKQHAVATARVRDAGLEGNVDVLLSDYRDVKGSYDRVVSIEMIEAVGHHRLPEYFAVCSRLLKPDGAMAIQAITMPDQGYQRYLRSVDVIRHFIFPGSCCPSRTAILQASSAASDLRVVHLEEIGTHYAETLRRWRHEFLHRWDEALRLGYDDAFLRLWEFYLAYCEAGFAERHVGNAQIVFTKPGSRLNPQVQPLPEWKI